MRDSEISRQREREREMDIDEGELEKPYKENKCLIEAFK